MKKYFIYLLILMLMTISAGTGQVPTFNKQRAFQYLVQQCDFGPRNPGSKGHQQCLLFLEKELRQCAEKVERQSFLYQVPGIKQTLAGTNLLGHFNINNRNRVLLCAHWDTRPWADMDEDEKNHQQPVLGANDGASGVAVLLEIAQHLKQTPPPYGVDLVFFDAEDAGAYQNDQSWAIGSREFARRIAPQFFPRFAILLDLIGDKNLEIFIEMNSQRYAPQLVKYVWNIAAELGIGEFYPTAKYAINDDHLSLIAAGIPCIDIIDYDYPHWHTIHDTPDNCSPESLEKVGRVVLEVIYRGAY